MLSESSRKGLNQLKKDLKNKTNWELRANAAYTLGEVVIGVPKELGHEFVGFIPDLLHLLKDKYSKVRYSAVFALGWLDRIIEVPIEPLLEVMKDEDSKVRAHAVAALGRIGKRAEIASEFLIVALKDSNRDVRAYSSFALGRIGGNLTIIVPLLCEMLKDADEKVSSHVASALSDLGAAAGNAVPSLIVAVQTAPQNTRYRAAEALGNIGGDAKEIIPILIEALADVKIIKGKEAEKMAKLSKTFLANSGISDPKKVSFLSKSLSAEKFSEKPLPNSDAIKAIISFGRDSIPYLEENLGNNNEWIRKGCIEILQKLGIDTEVSKMDDSDITIIEKPKSNLSQEKKKEVLDLITKQKKTRISWLATITQITEEELIILAKENDFHVYEDFIISTL